MIKRAAWIILGLLVVIALATLTGCATLNVKIEPPAGSAIPTGPAAFTATIERAPLALAAVTVDLRPVPRCSDSLKAPCWQTFSVQGLNYQTLTLNLLAQGREREEGSIAVTLMDSAGRVTGTMVRINGWGRRNGHSGI